MANAQACLKIFAVLNNYNNSELGTSLNQSLNQKGLELPAPIPNRRHVTQPFTNEPVKQEANSI